MDSFFEKSFSKVEIPSPERLFSRESSNLFLGSCFAENLYKYYKCNYIDSLFSPFGNIYNPLSLARSLEILCSNILIDDSEIFCYKELWRHFDFDTLLSTTDKNAYLDSINHNLKSAQDYIKKADNLFLTLGTSFVYKNKKSSDVVNNCHKQPSNHFTRTNASISQMTEKMIGALKQLKSLNPHIKIIMTLSPVRHLRDSAIDNSLSKARLRSVIDEISQELPIWYFPAYEIQLDQLRDYRWYNTDLAHPSETAVNFIMNRYVESACEYDFQAYLMETEKLNKSLNHRILHKDTEEAQRFLKSIDKRFESLIRKYPSMKKLKEKYDSHFSGNSEINKLT